ncbi:MAG: class I SAM-dependent methyltransferase [Proteobacteria bacterium]|nr:class I SAM-dependent methyltransferase [Pseudomonadota bacterium]
MGYVFDFKDSLAYEKWVTSQNNSFAIDLETCIMLDLLKPSKGETLLDIGCGTGTAFRPLIEKGIQVTGIDPSPYMLDIAGKNGGNKVDLYRGFAEDLPFEDNSFNHALIITTLEFSDNPVMVLEEASRVAKDRIFIGVLNRYAIKGVQRRVKGIFSKTIFNRAKFFSIWEIKQMIWETLGDVPVSWRTVCQFPASSGKIFNKIERSRIVQRFPFGTFAGIVVTLVPKMRTKPLALKYRPKFKTSIATGYEPVKNSENMPK